MAEPSPGSSVALKTARIWQPLVCLSLLTGIGLSALVMESAVHSETLGVWMDIKWAEVERSGQRLPAAVPRHRRSRRVAGYRRPGPVRRRRLFLRRLEHEVGDVRRRTCRLEQRKLVHNFGAGKARPISTGSSRNSWWSHKDILHAGPEKTLIVYGTGFLNAKPANDGPTTVFSNMWRRYGLYRYDFHKGIEPVTLGTAWDAYALEKARCTSFVHGLIDRAGRMAVPKALRRRNDRKKPRRLRRQLRKVAWDRTGRKGSGNIAGSCSSGSITYGLRRWISRSCSCLWPVGTGRFPIPPNIGK